MKQPKLMVTLREAAERTGLTYCCVRRLCLSGQISYIRSGVKYFVNFERLMEFLNRDVPNR